MSVIGPRAVSREEVEHFGDGRDLLLSVLPGVTGLWQAGDRNEAIFESGTRQAMELC